MNEELPDPEPASPEYDRPNQPWICGHADEGHACRLGPDRRGQCRAAPECAPVLEFKEGQTKGRWRCTRSGGACVEGPGPDGACGRPVLKCAPKPTLRWWRGRVTAAVGAGTVAVLLIILGGRWRGNFINRGELSLGHSSPAFLAAGDANKQPHESCGACHKAGNSSVSGLVITALQADPGITDFHKLARVTKGEMTLIDVACQKCHQNHLTHQEHVAVDLSCSSCHLEHHGPGRMVAPSDDRCVFCHGDAERIADDTTLLAGFTPRALARNFEVEHPGFRIHSGRIRDTNTLKFNHALHLRGQTIPTLPSGQKLDCAYCHQPDAAGIFIRKVQFEKHCQACHSLQFDPEAPGLTLPHGKSEAVSAFLRSLPKQYTDLAARSGILNRNEQEKFAQEKMSRLQQRVSSGDQLEQLIFFSDATAGPRRRIGSVSGPSVATYPGCAYCHEVKKGASGHPEVTDPVMPERWLHHGAFNHARHATMRCVQCHSAESSSDTADVIIPNRQSCAKCHSSSGGVANSCVTCHSFHLKTKDFSAAKIGLK